MESPRFYDQLYLGSQHHSDAHLLLHCTLQGSYKFIYMRMCMLNFYYISFFLSLSLHFSVSFLYMPHSNCLIIYNEDIISVYIPTHLLLRLHLLLLLLLMH